MFNMRNKTLLNYAEKTYPKAQAMANEYARAQGYNNAKRIVVYDGEVVSHGGVGWFEFMDDVRKGKYKK
jgi:hypothetical protein